MHTDDEQNPWRTLGAREVYDNAWINVRECDVIHPNNRPGIYGVVSFKNKAIGIIPLDDDLNTWIVGQWRYPLGLYSWEIPMGGGPLNDDVLTSAQRELEEETGLRAADWSELMRIHTSNSVTDEDGYVFVARGLQQGQTRFDDTEIIKIRKLPLRDAVRMVLDGQITDSISVGGLLKAGIQFGAV
ncbi:MAG: NUDIX hydrolase [Catalinimonas sp.]